MFKFVFGDVGSGKSIYQADETIYLLNRAKKLFKKYGTIREVWCNFHISEKYQKKFNGFYKYWRHPLEMIYVDYDKNGVDGEIRRDFDCVWDEIAVELPSDAWKDTHPEIRRFFAQHRKRGIQIFANTQDYKMLDINARRMVTEVYRTNKLIGSRDPSKTLAPIKIIWGIVLIWELDKNCIRQDDQDQRKLSPIPQFLLITKSLCDIYDTTEDITKGLKNKLLHFEFKCSKNNCDFVKTEHVKI